MKPLVLLATVSAVLASLVTAVPTGAQPVYVKSTELVAPPEVCNPDCGGAPRGIAYDGTYYYLSHIVATGDRFRGGVHVYRTDGTFVKVLEEGGPHGTYFASGVAVAGPYVWTSDYWGGNIYKYETATGRLIETFPLRPNLVSLSHDGRDLWTHSAGERRFYRVDPASHAVTGSFSISWPDSCVTLYSAPDGRGGMWISSAAAQSSHTCAPRTYRYALTEASPGALEATLVEQYDGFASDWGLTTNVNHRAEFVLVRAPAVGSGNVVFPVEHYLPLSDAIASVHLYQPEVSGCIKTKGTVRLAEPAPAGGLIVTLHSDNEHAVVPASVVVKEGALMKRFQILTSPVAVREDATITASVAGQEVTAILGVKPMVLKDLVLSPNPVVGGIPAVGTMTLQCPAAPGDIEVTLASRNPSVANPTVSHITIPFGTQVMTFDLTTTPVTRVYTPAISATANGVKRSRPLTVNPVP